MSWMAVIGPCWSCGQTFAYNAHRVPSIVIEGDRKAVCASCMERANEVRQEMGLRPHPIHPEAYEPSEEP